MRLRAVNKICAADNDEERCRAGFKCIMIGDYTLHIARYADGVMWQECEGYVVRRNDQETRGKPRHEGRALDQQL